MDHMVQEITKLSPVAGDVLVVRCTDELRAEALCGVLQGLRDVLPEGVRAAVVAGDTEVEIWSGDPMPRVVQEIQRQDRVSTYGTDRDGVRLAIACMQDELDETLEAFQAEKRPIEGRTWERTQDECVQLVAIGLRLLRDLENGRAS